MRVPKRLTRVIFAVVSTSTAFGLPAVAAIPETNELSGSVVATLNGKEFRLPLLEADYDVDIDGDVAHVALTQTFFNPTSRPLHATYLFPMNQKAALHAMRMELDGETVVARIQEKEQATATFNKAKAEGKAASLLTQHRPNMFTQDIAHLMPGRPVRITIEYVQNVPKIDGAYELVIPMVVGPRYEGGVAKEPVPAFAANYRDGEVATPTDAQLPSETDLVSGWHIEKLPDYPRVIGQDAPENIDPNRVSLDLSLASPIPVSALWSDTHALSVIGDETRKTVRFMNGRDIDNRDFVLRYELASETHVSAGLTSHFDQERGGYLSLLIEPPKLPAEQMIGQREMVFVLDTSGSMRGLPMEASKTFMKAAIRALRPDDYVRILRFSNNTSQFAAGPVLANERNKQAALRFVSGLSASGGTELNRAINTAFDMPQPDNTTRIVVFLTDGYIGAESQVIASISRRIGNARIYAFGVGDAINRYLLEAMAKEGRGYARIVPVGEDANEVAESLAAKLKTPLLTDISIDWNGLTVNDQAPYRIPDLFEGGSVRVLGRYPTGGKHRIYVEGMVNGRPARMPLDVDLMGAGSETAETAPALPLIWAREQIFDKDRDYAIGGGSDRSLKDEITQLGLTYSLQSPFTSFVAVSERKVNEDPTSATQASVPLPQVSGVSANAYPSLNLSGSSTPEPEGIFGIVMLLLALAARFRRRLSSLLRKMPDTLAGLFRRRRERGAVEMDRSLPRPLRQDGWWLET